MKLTSVFLLFIFSCVVFHVGTVCPISAEEYHHSDQDGPYIAIVYASRQGGLKQHVVLRATASCESERGRNGRYYLDHVRLLTPGGRIVPLKKKKHDDSHGGEIDGRFYEQLNEPYYKNEPFECTVTSDVEGEERSDPKWYVALAMTSVGPMPHPPVTPLPIPDDDDGPIPDDDDCQCDEVGLYSVNGSYTATPGESHEACVTTDAPYSEIYWYVASPGETGFGTQQEIDTGDGTTTKARFSYTFPSGAMHTGTYKITAYIYRSDLSVYWEDYTVDVSVD